MKRRTKFILLLIAVLLAILAGLAVWQRENLKALYLYLTLDKEAVSQRVDETRQEHQQALENDFSITVKPPSIEQSEQLLDGTANPDEIKQNLGIVTPPVQTEQPPQSEQPAPPQKTAEELVNDCVAELYALKVDVMGTLGGMKQNALDQWRALPQSQRTNEKKVEIGLQVLDQCYGFEVVVDGQVLSILDRYRPLLTEINADVTVLDTLWTYYCEEKASEKAYYLSKYL